MLTRLPSLFGSSRKREVRAKPEYQFATFCGFTYEFEKSYGVQILDITDPIYEYWNGNGLNSKGIETRGSSYCTWEDANAVVRMWKSARYSLFFFNCQHFADAMLDFFIVPVINLLREANGKIAMLNLPSILTSSCAIVPWYVAMIPLMVLQEAWNKLGL